MLSRDGLEYTYFVVNILQLPITILGLIFIYRQLSHLRVDSTRKTLEILNNTLNSDDYLKLRRDFSRTEELVKLETLVGTTKDEVRIVRRFCNIYELLCLNTRLNLMDEGIFKEFWKSTLISDWARCADYLTAERRARNNPAFGCEFEAMAKKWQSPGTTAPTT